MNVTMYREPCLLLETMELVYSYMAQEPVDRLLGKGEFCIPKAEILRIREEVCGQIDRSNKELQFYFNGVPQGNDIDERNFCLASAILYTPLSAPCSDVDELAALLLRQWESIQRPYAINNINAFGLSISTSLTDDFRPFSEEVAKLPLPSAFQAQLVDVFTDYGHYLTRLVEILRPLAMRLAPLLEPWVQRAMPLIERWDEHLRGDNPLGFIRDRSYLILEKCEELHASIRFFPSKNSYLLTRNGDRNLCMMFGIDAEVGGHLERPPETLTEWEMLALRQLGNHDRIAMLQAMMNRSMSGADLVQELNLHSGTVFRDLNNMGRALLIDREIKDGRNVYRTNPARLRKLMERVIQVIASQDE